MLRKRIQLGLIHAAVAMTLVPINSTLNRVMIKELALSAALVAVLASLPYLFSPIQVAIGSFSDRYPLAGYRRTPYIIIGLLLCVVGVVLSPLAAFRLATDWWSGLSLGLLAFGAWGMGFNFATVSYLSLASEISGEEGRGKTVAIMWFMMIVGIILTAVLVSRLVDPYTPDALRSAFGLVGLSAAGLGLLGLIKLEAPYTLNQRISEKRYSWGELISSLTKNKPAATFFFYLVILLVAILGQDILLEPFAGEAFNMAVKTTTRITSLWGGCVLLSLALAGVLESRYSKRLLAAWGGGIALSGFVLISLSGVILSRLVFYAGVVLLGLGTGVATVSNLSLMLDMTIASNVGLYMGAWGMANAVSRLIGSIMGGILRDALTFIFAQPVLAYVGVFVIEAFLLGWSLILLHRIDVSAFQRQARQPSLGERAALANDA